MKKLLAFILLFTGVVCIASLSDVDASQLTEEEIEFERVMETQAYKWKKFTDKKIEKKYDYFFDTTYGGVYFKEEKLYVNVTKGNMKKFKEEFDVEIDYELVEVDYSMKELEKIKEKLSIDVRELSIRAISIDEINNVVVVQTELNSMEFDSLLNKNIDRNALVVQKWDTEPEERVNYTTNGERIHIGKLGLFSGRARCTVGFAAKDSSGNPGIVTAGHCLKDFNYGKNAYYDGDHAGDARNYRYHDGDVDAGFVELQDHWYSRWLPTKELVFGDSYDYLATDFSSYYAVGTNVRFYGTYGVNFVRTTTIDYGEITLTSWTYYGPNNEVWSSNMVRTDQLTHDGDSGGPLVITIYVGEGYYEDTVIGILSLGIGSISYFSKTSDILSELNLTAY